MIYDMVCNTLQDLNPNALPLDDLARAEMPNLMELAKKYRRGFINRYEYLKATCDIMGYSTDMIKGFFVEAVYDDGNMIINVFEVEDDAYEAIDRMVEDDELIEAYGLGHIEQHDYVVIERR